MESIRAFLGITLTERNQEIFAQFLRKIKQSIPDGLTWVDSKNIHLTLKFLGSTTIAGLNNLTHHLEEKLSDIHQFKISFTEIGAFPNVKRPRAIWIGVNTSIELFSLIRSVDEVVAKSGYKAEERSISPHITFARIKKTLGTLEILSIGEKLNKIESPQLDDHLLIKINLIKSELKPSGPIYSLIQEFPIS